MDSTTACMKDEDNDGYGDIRIFEGLQMEVIVMMERTAFIPMLLKLDGMK